MREGHRGRVRLGNWKVNSSSTAAATSTGAAKLEANRSSENAGRHRGRVRLGSWKFNSNESNSNIDRTAKLRRQVFGSRGGTGVVFVLATGNSTQQQQQQQQHRQERSQARG
jgi:hypothetical protein